MALAKGEFDKDTLDLLMRIQNDLFDLGADLCTPDMHMDATLSYTPLRMISGQVDRLEREIDAMNDKLTPLRSFILPGGSALAAQLHLVPADLVRHLTAFMERAGAEERQVISSGEHARTIRRLRQQGVVYVRFAVARDGAVSGLKLGRSSMATPATQAKPAASPAWVETSNRYAQILLKKPEIQGELKLTVAGMVESTSGGFKFPDSTVQTSAAVDTTSPGGTATRSAAEPSPGNNVNSSSSCTTWKS